MPNYPWLMESDTDIAALTSKLSVQRILGVPYPEMTAEEIESNVMTQASAIAANLKTEGIYIAPEKQIVALIAYLQQMGHYEVVTPKTANR